MTNPKAKTIKLLLEDGTLKGVMSIVDSFWNSGEMYSAPRESIDSLLSSDACKKAGVYLLLSEDKVYVGQSSDLEKRIKQHIVGKVWWERVLVLTTSDDSLNRVDIEYLEHFLIDKAEDSGRLVTDNKKRGNNAKVDRFRKTELKQYLDEALFLLELIGVNVFSKEENKTNYKKTSKRKKTAPKSKKQITKKSVSEKSILIQSKKDAITFLEEKGVYLRDTVNYAKINNNSQFWINPSLNVVSKDWELILNNMFSKKLYYLFIPADSFNINGDDDNSLSIRKDKNCIDIHIIEETFIDRDSHCDFSKYIVKQWKY